MEEDKKEYKTPTTAVDAIVTKEKADRSGYEILLITRGRPPFKGQYAFPGGFVEYGEDPKEAVLRELKEECSI